MHQKCSNYALTNLLFGLCRSMWIIELLVTLPGPHFKAPARPFIPKVLRAKERAPTPYPSTIFTFRLAIETTKKFGGASIIDNHVLLVQKNLCILKAIGKTCASVNKYINSMSSSQKWMLICSSHIVLIPWPPTIYLWNLLGSKFLLCNYVRTYIVQNWSGLIYLGFKRHIIPH